MAHLNTCGMTAPSNFRGFLRIFVDSQEWTFHDARKSPFPRMATATGDRRVASHCADAHRAIRNLRRSSCPDKACVLDDRGRRLQPVDALRDRSSVGSALARRLARSTADSTWFDACSFSWGCADWTARTNVARQQCGVRSLSLVLVLRSRDRLSRRSLPVREL